MSATATWAHRREAAAVWLAWRPAWPLAALALVAWLVMLATSDPVRAAFGSTPAPASGPVGTAPLDVTPWAWSCSILGDGAASRVGPGSALLGWTVMSVAMMAPTLLPAAQHAALGSVRRRRHRAVALVAAAGLGTWVVVGTVYLGAVAGLTALGDLPLTPVALLVAGGWQLTRWKRRAVTWSGRPVPLPPFGRRADLACLRFGLVQGARCLRSTWALMLVMAVVGHEDLLVMLALTAVMLVEERLAWAERVRRPFGWLLVGLAVLVA